MIYVVSGIQRSGTSMIMYALKQGGMDIYYNKDRERELRGRRPAVRNPVGYWEPALKEFNEIDFPLRAEGMAVKILTPWIRLGTLPVHEYKILILKRDIREIVLSICKMNAGIITTGDWHIYRNYDKYIQKGIDLAKNRKDVVDVHIAEYNDVLVNPRGFFEKLGWPVEVKKAAMTVDPTKKTVNFTTPFCGDLDKEFNVTHGTIEDMVISGRLNVPEAMKKAVESGAKLSMEAI